MPALVAYPLQNADIGCALNSPDFYTGSSCGMCLRLNTTTVNRYMNFTNLYVIVDNRTARSCLHLCCVPAGACRASAPRTAR